jgi:hypothetical protein
VNATVKTVADNLKSHPVAFALLVVIFMFLTAELYVLRTVSTNTQSRFDAQDRLLDRMATDCFPARDNKKGDRQ